MSHTLLTLCLLAQASPVGTSTTATSSVAMVASSPLPVAAADLDLTEILDFELHAFVSQGAFYTTDNDYLGQSERGSLAFSEVGLNVTKQLLDDLRAGIQLFARYLGGRGGLDARFDWFYLDYRFEDWLRLRVGRLKLPFGLYNEFNDIDVGRVPILMPEGVYPLENRDYLLAQLGAELYGYVRLGAAGGLDYRLYGGTFGLENDGAVADGFRLDRIDVPYVAGARLIWETPLPSLRLAASGQMVRLEASYLAEPGVADALKAAGLAPADFDGRLGLEIPAYLWLVSAEYTRGDLLLAAEYGRWRVRFDSTVDALFAPTTVPREQLYVMAWYRVTDYLWPGAYYTVFFPDTRDRGPPSRYQHDVALTLRFDINPFWLLKLEAHYLDGTAYLDSAENDGVPLDQLEQSWWLFVAKTTLYF